MVAANARAGGNAKFEIDGIQGGSALRTVSGLVWS